jgi:hypothetical protein
MADRMKDEARTQSLALMIPDQGQLQIGKEEKETKGMEV